jgi:hypothetical protein
MKERSPGAICVTEINVGRFYQPSYMYAGAGYNLVQLFFDLALKKAKPTDYSVRANISENRYWIRGLDVPPVVCDIERFLEPGQSCD